MGVGVIINGLRVELEGSDMGFSTHPTNIISCWTSGTTGADVHVCFHRRHPKDTREKSTFGTELYFYKDRDFSKGHYSSRYYPENKGLPPHYICIVEDLMRIYDQVFDLVQDPNSGWVSKTENYFERYAQETAGI